MFICQKCGEVIGPKVPAHMVVTKQRRKVYPQRTQEIIATDEDGRDPRRETVILDAGGSGLETVQEIQVCADCVKKVTPVIVQDKPADVYARY